MISVFISVEPVKEDFSEPHQQILLYWKHRLILLPLDIDEFITYIDDIGGVT